MISWFWQERSIRGRNNRLCFIVDIDGEDWQKCHDFKQWNDRDRNDYTRGLVDGSSRIGKLGEVAAGALLKKEPDFAFREGGDSADFTVLNHTIDVKTTANSHVQCYLCVQNEDGYTMPWQNKDLFIVSHITEIAHKRIASVQIIGYFTLAAVEHLPNVRSPYGGHINKHLKFEESQPIERFADLLRERNAKVVHPSDDDTVEIKEYVESMGGVVRAL